MSPMNISKSTCVPSCKDKGHNSTDKSKNIKTGIINSYTYSL